MKLVAYIIISEFTLKINLQAKTLPVAVKYYLTLMSSLF